MSHSNRKKQTRLPKVLAVAAAVLSLTGCTSDYLPCATPQMVVEGWIEYDRHPFVRVTTTVPVSKDYMAYDSLDSYVLSNADVTISDGNKTVKLMSLYSQRYSPPFIFTTDDIVGTAGKSYTLTVDCGDYHASAVTTVPQPVAVDSCRVEAVESNDTLFHIRVFMTFPQGHETYYKFFTREMNGQKLREYYPSYLGVFSSGMAADGVFVNRGRYNMDTESSYTPYFTRGTTVRFKAAHIDSVAYDYWRRFEDAANFSRIPTLSGDYSLSGNVAGALGYWFGYGSVDCEVKIGQ